MSREWSNEQRAVFDFFAMGTGNCVVEAFAGTGKTTTILEAMKYASAQRPLLCAFNKRIADEMKAKCGGAFEVKTLHGVGFGIIRRYWDNARVDQKRSYDLARAAAGIDAPDAIVKKVQKLAGLGKGAGVHPDDTKIWDTILNLSIIHDCEPDDEWIDAGWTAERVCQLAILAMQRARQVDDDGACIDFDDMIYLPLANGWARPMHDLVIVDEAQDMNPTQLELARRVCRPDGRIVVVGDRRQAIYSFRGADSNAIERMKTELSAQVLKLTTTYRCGKAIVEQARKIVPDFNAHESNGAGEVKVLASGLDALVAAAEIGDFVLSRKNAPLVRVCLALLRKGKAARIEGRDVAASLRSIVKRWNKVRNVEQLLERIDRWKEREIAKAKKHGDTPATQEKCNTVTDQAEVLKALCEGIATPAELEARLTTMFGDSETDRRPTIVCSSIHRSKGLEADRVFILRETLYPNRMRALALKLPSEPDPIEEQNLEYVAVTRAKRTLVWATLQ